MVLVVYSDFTCMVVQLPTLELRPHVKQCAHSNGSFLDVVDQEPRLLPGERPVEVVRDLMEGLVHRLHRRGHVGG